MSTLDESIASAKTESVISPMEIHCDSPHPLSRLFGVADWEAIATDIIRESQRPVVWVSLSLLEYGPSKMEMVHAGWLVRREVQGLSMFELSERAIALIYYKQSKVRMTALETSLKTARECLTRMTVWEHLKAAAKKIFPFFA